MQAIEQEIAIETDDRLVDSATEEQIWQRANLSPCEKRQMINARMGQGIFRENVELIEKDCRVTGVLDRRHLRARHIKPWKFCNDREKLDGFNGLLLSPHIDHLFDRGHISFADNGRVLHLNAFESVRDKGLGSEQDPGPALVPTGATRVPAFSP